MSAGRLIAVVGPSGVGKDSLMEALCAARPDFWRVRRVITRPSEAGGEDFEGVSEAEFLRREAEGAFVLSWQAHDLHYGIPMEAARRIAEGAQAVANLSRGAVFAAAERFPGLHVLSVTANPEILAARLAKRGREDADGIARRLSRPAPEMPVGVATTTIDNSGAMDDSVAVALAALYPVSA
ncbi:MAG: phosphonate metabolism protein/1,5-bisphosphokinase (PRPP-forming) PhnN [Pseudomonadota bacterium]